MPTVGPPHPTIEVPDPHVAEVAVRHARSLFRRTLATWASDVLRLRRDGVLDAVWPADATGEGWSQAA